MSGERILVVDDELNIVDLCRFALEQEGYQAQGVNSGRAALEILAADPFDLLVVDIKMPDVDGLTVLRRARTLDPNLTCVVITGYATMDRTIDALRLGARGFLLKPFGVEELLTTVDEALAQRQREQERIRLRAQLPIWEIGQAQMTEGDVESLAEHLLFTLVQQTGAEGAGIMLLDEKGDELSVLSAVGLAAAALKGTSVAAGQGLGRQALESDEPLILDLHQRDNLKPAWQGIVVGCQAEVLVLVSMRTRKRSVGLLCLGYPPGSTAIPDSERTLLSIMGRQVASALENARMYALEQQRTLELSRALKRQEELDRLKDEFIRNVSHEFRTPLSLILAYAELIGSGDLGEVNTEQQKPVHIIRECALLLKTLVDDMTLLLDLQARKTTRDLVAVDELVRGAVTSFQVLAERADLVLSEHISAPIPPIWAEGPYLRRAVDNLLANAIKFTPAGGSIDVTLCARDDCVVLEVADTGIGIAAEHHERIFDRFYQVDGSIGRQYGGSGLGLALVKEIIERHQGTVRVTSQVGQGSTFAISLPIANPL